MVSPSQGSNALNAYLLTHLGPSDAIWCWGSWSTLVQVMACCLTAPSHYLNHCWLVISKVLWHSSEDIIIRRFEDTNQQSKIENYIFKITLRFPRGQWVNYPNHAHHAMLPFSQAELLLMMLSAPLLLLWNHNTWQLNRNIWYTVPHYYDVHCCWDQSIWKL